MHRRSLIVLTLLAFTLTDLPLCRTIAADLTDEQIQAAITRGSHVHFSLTSKDLPGLAKTIRWGAYTAYELTVLSDSDRIALAAAQASPPRGLLSSPSPPFSISDARASIDRFGVTWVVLKTKACSVGLSTRGRSTLSAWDNSSVKIDLDADGRTVAALTNVQYLADWPSGQNPVPEGRKPWNPYSYYTPTCVMPGDCNCVVATRVFPALHDVTKLKVIITAGDGRSTTKEVAPTLFESRLDK